MSLHHLLELTLTRRSLLCPAFLLFSVLHTSSYSQDQAVTESHEILMAIFAHPDDESVIAPLLAKYARQQVEVYLVFATGGGKGLRKHAGIPMGEPLARARMNEARCAARHLGVRAPIFLGLEDGSLGDSQQFTQLHHLLDSLLDRNRPTAVITWDPGGYYGHIDHRMISNVVTELYQEKDYLSNSRLFYFGVPSWNKEITDTLRTILAKALVNATLSTRRSLFTHQITWSVQDREAARAALSCHQSQFTPAEMKDLFFLNTAENVIHLRSAFATGQARSSIWKD